MTPGRGHARMTDLADAAHDLRSRHRPGTPLVLPNAWDPPSATLVEQAGFAAVATSSAAMLAAIGRRDGGSTPPDEVFAAIARIATAVRIPVTADIEDGYGLLPTELVDRLLSAGAVGCNLEDTDHHHSGRMIDANAQAERLAGVRAAGHGHGVELVINARIDTYVHPIDGQQEETLRRAALYAQAGADCVYPILIPEAELGVFLARHDGPVNVLAPPERRAITRLAALGVARISMGSRLANATQQFLSGLLAELHSEG
jgi:2-methylisocitrate lyase-like PEP mutase family enzyme